MKNREEVGEKVENTLKNDALKQKNQRFSKKKLHHTKKVRIFTRFFYFNKCIKQLNSTIL